MKTGRMDFKQKAAVSGWHGLAAVTAGLVVFAGIACAFAAALCQVDIPVRVLTPLMIGAVCAGVFTGAFLLGALQKRRGLLLGAGFGLLVFVLLWVASALQGSSLLTQLAAIKVFSIVITGAFGGYLGVLRSEHKKKLR